MIKYLKYKDYKNRKKNFKKEYNKFIFALFLKRRRIGDQFKFKFMLKNQLLFNKNFKTKIINRCIITSKTRSVNRVTSLTKNSFKNLYDYGKLMGFKKSSW